MITRKCGTCRFFQNAGIACSGWCTHPERGDLHDLVLVRRAELACRNSWDEDLWEAAEQMQTVRPTVPVKTRVPMPSVTPENPTDRVTSIDIARPDAAKTSTSKHPAVAGGQEARRRSPAPESRANPKQGQAPSADIPRRGVSSLEPSFSRALHGPNDGQRRSHRASQSEDARTVVVSPPAKQEQPPAPRFARSAEAAAAAPQLADDTTPLPTEEVNLGLQAAALQAPVQYIKDDRATDTPLVHVDGLYSEAQQTREAFVGAEAMPAVVAPPISPLDDTSWVAGIPRCCDTCREFHRDASGKRGYCRSPYAFSGRTMVQSDELACRSSVGLWWLPSDDIWLERADISHHTRPTPFLDAILADIGQESR